MRVYVTAVPSSQIGEMQEYWSKFTGVPINKFSKLTFITAVYYTANDCLANGTFTSRIYLSGRKEFIVPDGAEISDDAVLALARLVTKSCTPQRSVLEPSDRTKGFFFSLDDFSPSELVSSYPCGIVLKENFAKEECNGTQTMEPGVLIAES